MSTKEKTIKISLFGFFLFYMLFNLNAFADDVIIYGANAYGNQELFEINVTQGTVGKVTDLSTPTQAMDQDPDTGFIYYYDFFETGADEFLYYDPTMNHHESVEKYSSYPGFIAKCMAFAPDGTLYVMSNEDELYIIDKDTGQTIFVGLVTGLEQGPQGRTGDIAFTPGGTLYIATYASLYTIDLGTLQATLLYSNMISSQADIKVWTGLAYYNGALYASDIESINEAENDYVSAFYRINPSDGQVVKLFNLPAFLNDLTSSTSVTPVINYHPVINAIGDKTVSEGDILEFTVIASDQNPGDNLSYFVSGLPASASFNPVTQEFSWLPNSNDVGFHKITFIVTDDGTPILNDSHEVIIEVIPALPPTVVNILEGETDTQDAAIGSGSYTFSNLGGAPTTIAVGRSSVTARSLIKWDVTSIPAGSTIVSAQMSYYSYDYSGGSTATISAYRLLKPWVEGTLNGQDRQMDDPDSVCWAESGNGLSWGIAGADGPVDRSTTAIASATHQGNGWFNWDIKTAVQNWVDGNWANDGLILKANNESVTNMRLFTSSEYQNGIQKPNLEIEYSEEAGLLNYPPVIEPLATQTVEEGDLLAFSITASEYNATDQLTYDVENLPPGANFNSNTHEFSWIPGPGDIGNHSVTFHVTDDGIPVLSASTDVIISVTPFAGEIETTELIGVSKTKDATLGSGSYALLNLGGAPTTFAVGNNAVTARSLIQWDLSSIPPDSLIVSARMSLYAHSFNGGAEPVVIDAHRLLKPWVEGTLNAQDRQLDNPDSTCWAESGNGLAWEIPGAGGTADRAPVVIGSESNTGTGWYYWDIRGPVQNWLDGTWQNNGMILTARDESAINMRVFVASEYQSTIYKPVLEIEYVAP